MLKLVSGGEEPANDPGTYWRLTERMEPEPCSRAEHEAFEKTYAAVLAETRVGDFVHVVTRFEGVDDFSPLDDPHSFMTVWGPVGSDYGEAEGSRTWKDALATHQRHVDEMTAGFEAYLQKTEPRLL